MNIIEQIRDAKYVVTGEMVKELARRHISAERNALKTEGTLLSALIGTTQNEVFTRHLEPLEALEIVYKRDFHPWVIEALKALGVRKSEMNRRSGFARSSKSSLSRYLEFGGAIDELDAAKTTKKMLYNYVKERKPKPDQAKVIEFTADAIIARIRITAKTDRDEAVRELQTIIEDLQNELMELEGDEVIDDRPRIVRHNLDEVRAH